MIRVLLVDDQELVRSGFRIILESEPDIEVVGEAANGAEAVRLAAELAPDVICMDVEMPVMDGIAASRAIVSGGAGSAGSGSGSAGSAGSGSASSGSAPAILVLTTFGHDAYLFDALAAGVSGFLLKTSRAEQLIEAVRTLAAGKALLGPDVTRAVMARASGMAAGGVSGASGGSGDGTTDPGAGEGAARSAAGREAGSGIDAAAMEAAGLTEREREVLGLVASGKSNGEIAAELFLGEATVKTHVSNLLQKLGARDRIQLVVWAHTRGAA